MEARSSGGERYPDTVEVTGSNPVVPTIFYFLGRGKMDWPRALGICIVMIIPTFVGAGIVWEILHSWFAEVIWVIIMGGVSFKIAKSKAHLKEEH